MPSHSDLSYAGPTPPAHRAGLTRLSPAALIAVLLAHVAVGAGIMAARSPVVQPPEAPALMVEVLQAEPPKPKQPDITAPKPKPMAKREQVARAPEIPVLAAKPTTPEPVANEVKQVPPAPLPPIPTPPAPTQANVPVAANAVPVAAPAPTPPKFDAEYLDNPIPTYPPISKHERETGKVFLRVYVEASGSPSKVDLQTSSGFERLDKAAIATVRRWRFVPARQGSEAVAGWVVVPVNFNLNPYKE